MGLAVNPSSAQSVWPLSKPLNLFKSSNLHLQKKRTGINDLSRPLQLQTFHSKSTSKQCSKYTKRSFIFKEAGSKYFQKQILRLLYPVKDMSNTQSCMKPFCGMKLRANLIPITVTKVTLIFSILFTQFLILYFYVDSLVFFKRILPQSYLEVRDI